MPVSLSDHAKALADARTFATLGTLNADGSPHLSVLWITRDGDDLLLSTVVGRQKERNLRRDPRLSVILINSDDPYDYAEIRGRASLIEAGGRELIDALSAKYRGRPYDAEPAGTVRVVIRVTADRVVR